MANISEKNFKNKSSFGTPHATKEDETGSNSINDENSTNILQQFKTTITFPSMLEIMSNNSYADVLLISSDEQEIPSYRVLLAQYSKEFDKIFKESIETPIKIKVENCDAETIKAAIQFICGHLDAIKKNESSVLKFAIKYQIQVLKTDCILNLKNSINTQNVCELIQIAYENGLDELKNKCLKALVEMKKEIPAQTLYDLPGEILTDALYYKKP